MFKLLNEVEFLQIKQSTQVLDKLRRLFKRAQLEKNELNILRGIATSVQKCLNKP